MSMRDPVDLMGDPLLFSHEHRRRDDLPEIRFFAAILEDVCFCLTPTSLVDFETRIAAVAWIRGEVDSITPCSFREICEILDLDQDATLARLLALASGETLERRRRLDTLIDATDPEKRPVAAVSLRRDHSLHVA